MSIADAITAGSFAIAALSFVAGVTAWKREFIGRRRIELAETTLAQFYEASDVIRAIRSPFSYEGEGSSRKRSDSESEEESKILDQAYIVFERYDARKELFAELRSLKYRFMATFGKDAGKPFDELNRSTNKIFVSARMLGRYIWPRQGRAEMTEQALRKHLEMMTKHESVFWEGEENDEIRKEVDAAVAQIELITKETMKLVASMPRWRRFICR